MIGWIKKIKRLIKKKKELEFREKHLIRTTDFKKALDALEAGQRVEWQYRKDTRYVLTKGEKVELHSAWTQLGVDKDSGYFFGSRCVITLSKESCFWIYPKKDFRWRVKSFEEITRIANRLDNGDFKFPGSDNTFKPEDQRMCGEILSDIFVPDDELQKNGRRYSEWMLEKVWLAKGQDYYVKG